MIIMRYLAVLFCFLCLACEPADSGTAQAEPAASSGFSSQDVLIETANGAEHRFQVELALTPGQQAQGLMNRTNLADDRGMLFWFGVPPKIRNFWMKNTLIPLDILYIAESGRIIHIGYGQPQDLTPIPSSGAIVAALEIKGGMAEKLDIREGDRVRHPFLKNL